MKNIKSVLSLLLSAAVLSVCGTAECIHADTSYYFLRDENNYLNYPARKDINCNLNDVISSFGDDALVIKQNSKGYVITGQGEQHCFYEASNLTVTMREGAVLSSDTINEKLKPYSVKVLFSQIYGNTYITLFANAVTDDDLKKAANIISLAEVSDEILEKVCDTLKADEDVISIVRYNYISYQDIDTGKSICINSPLSAAELIKEYPELQLEERGKIYPGDDDWDHCFTYNIEKYSDLCEPVKRMQNNNVEFYLDLSPSEEARITPYVSEASVLFSRISETGDIDGSGKIDVTDLTELSLFLIGDRELTANQQLTADIDADGAVTLADLARLQQYLSKKIEVL